VLVEPNDKPSYLLARASNLVLRRASKDDGPTSTPGRIPEKRSRARTVVKRWKRDKNGQRRSTRRRKTRTLASGASEPLRTSGCTSPGDRSDVGTAWPA
jgi:hypothetical protein